MKKNILVLIAGGSGSGKTTVANKINNLLNGKKVNSQIICLDNFYIKDTKKMPKIDDCTNYDHPDSFEWSLIKKTIKDLKNGKKTNIPVYDYVEHCRAEEEKTIFPSDVIILEGILSFYDKEIVEMADLKLYIDTPDDERFIRRLKRDVIERGRSIDSIILQWRTMIFPMFDEFIKSSKVNADLIVPWYYIDDNGLDLLSNGIINQINLEK